MIRLLRKFKFNKGLTLVELLVVVGIVAMLAAMLQVSLSKGRQRAHEVDCLTRLKNISYGLEMYFREHGEYPKDNLATTLASYVGGPINFCCPSSGYSYEKFYVVRDKKVAADKYVIGCPYHSNQSRGLTTFAYGITQPKRLGRVTWNGVPINVGDEVTGGVLSFEDGSTVTFDGDSTALVVASFRTDAGPLYSIVRVLKSHEATLIDYQVNPGSKFEVIAPAGIAGVQGTEFELETEITGTKYKLKVKVDEGVVQVTDRNGQTYTLYEGDELEIEEEGASCPDDPPEN